MTCHGCGLVIGEGAVYRSHPFNSKEPSPPVQLVVRTRPDQRLRYSFHDLDCLQTWIDARGGGSQQRPDPKAATS